MFEHLEEKNLKPYKLNEGSLEDLLDIVALIALEKKYPNRYKQIKEIVGEKNLTEQIYIFIDSIIK